MPSASYTGRAAYVSWKGTVVSAPFRRFEQEEEIGLEEFTVGPNGSAKAYQPTFVDGRGHLELVAQRGATATYWDLFKPSTTAGVLVWGEEGSTAGSPRHAVTAYVMNRKKTVVYDDVTVVEVEFQFNGPVSDTTF